MAASDHVKVLMVDDDPADLELTRRMLCELGQMQFDVTTTDRLPGALKLLGEQRFDVMLLDLNLPGSNGLTTLDAVRRVNDELPIIALTGLSDEETALRALNHGGQDYLVKGKVTRDGLVNSIRYAIQRQQLLCDITEAKQLLQKKNEHLAELYRTAHRFVDNVSHEFRTPLTVVKEYVSLIRDGLVGSVTDEQRQFLDIVSDRADDLNTMVDDMLDVSRLEAGLLGACRKTCRVEEIVDKLRTALERKAVIKGITLDFEISPRLREVYCDIEKVGRVIINLAINAIKFCSEQGSVLVWAKENPHAPGVIVGVTDTGPGIEEGSLKKIFERFQQLDTNIRASCKGFGLGLNIAQELVELNFGSMNVESKVGEGSTFSFTLPPADPVEVMRRYLHRAAHVRDGSSKISLITARVDHSCGAASIDDADAYLHGLLRRDDLVFDAGRGRWLIVVASTELELNKFYENATKILDAINRNRVRGALPTIAMRTEGTWHVVNQSGAILTRLRQLIQERELAHV